MLSLKKKVKSSELTDIIVPNGIHHYVFCSEIGIDFYYRGVHHVLLTHGLVRSTSFIDVSTLTSSVRHWKKRYFTTLLL